MRYLLDTHVLIWARTDDEKNLGNLRDILKKQENKCYVSIASLWEIAIKYALQKLDLKSSLEEIFTLIEVRDFTLTAITQAHILRLANLEQHHRDPFDRLIIAQAIVEDLVVLTKDKAFSLYPVVIKSN